MIPLVAYFGVIIEMPGRQTASSDVNTQLVGGEMMMKKRSFRWALTSVVCASVAAVIVGAGENGPQYSLPERALVFPMTEVVQITPQKVGDPVALFDSKTGAVYRLRGTVANPSSRVYWQLAIPAVGKTSGLLRLQNVPALRRVSRHRIAGALDRRPNVPLLRDDDTVLEIRDGETFLVDVITGDTWLFRQRSETNLELGTWDPVDIFAYGKGNRPYSEMPVKFPVAQRP